MKWFSATCKQCISKLWLIGAVLLVTTAISFSLLRASLPYLNEYRQDLSAWLYRVHHIDLTFDNIDGRWQGVGPLITIDGLRLSPSEQVPVALTVERATIQLDVRNSLLSLAPRFNLVTLEAPRMTVNQGDGSSGFDPQSVMAVLFRQFQRIALERGELILSNGQQQSPVIPIAELNWLGSAERHQLSAQLGRQNTAAPLSLLVDLYGTPEQPLRGRLFAKASDLQWLDWLRPLLPTGVRLRDGLFNFEFWGEFSQQQLDSAMLRLGHNHLEWQGQDRVHQLTTSQGQLQWLQISEGWQLQTSDLQLATNGLAWSDPDLRIRQRGETLYGSLAPLELAHLSPLAGLIPTLEDAEVAFIERLEVSGQLRDFNWRYRDGQWDYQGALEQLGWRQSGVIPAVNDLNAKLNGDQSSGQISLSLKEQWLDFGEHLRAPIQVESLQGAVSWQFTEQQWRVQSQAVQLQTPELSTQLAFQLASTDQQSPVLSLYGELALSDAARAGDYYPITVMSDALVDYLNGALLGGHIDQGQVLWQGPLAHFPYSDNSGIFQVAALIQEAEFKFQPDWPALTDSRLQLDFEDASMRITGLEGQLQQLQFDHLNAEIPHLGREAELLVDFSLEAQPQHITDVMLASPLAGSVGRTLQTVTIGEPVQGNVALHIPLAGGAVKSKGTVTFKDNLLTVESLGLRLPGLNGVLTFDDGELNADKLQLQWYEQPFEVALKSQHSAEFYGVEIDLLGGWHTDKIPSQWKAYLDNYASGSLDWQGKLLLKIAAEDLEYQANFRSPMKGLALKLPNPLNKYIAQEEELIVSVTGDLARGQVTAGFGTRAELLTQYTLAGDDSGKEVLNISAIDLLVGRRFTAQDPLSTADTTLRVELDELALDQWQQFINNLDELDRSDSLLPPFRRIEAVVKRLQLYGQELSDAKVKAQRQADGWVIKLRSAQVAGQIKLYHDLPNGGLEANFERFQLSLENSSAITQLSQEELQGLPPLKFHCDHCIIGDLDIGAVDFTTRPSDDGLEILSLTAKTAETLLSISGRWGFDEHGEYSRIKGELESKDFDKTLMELGYASNVRDSDGSFDFDLRWQGSLYQPRLETLSGELGWRLGEGHLAEISDKGARIFSLFSLDSLRRKLALDFRDVFQKGLFYNDFKGSFQISNGVAITDNSHMDGVAGDLTVSGSYNFTNNGLDYLLVFSPKLISNLPVVAGVMASAPQVFLLTFAITKVLEPMVEVVSQVRFRLTGTVDKPELVELERKRRSFKVPQEMLPKDVTSEVSTPKPDKIVPSPMAVVPSQ